LRSLLAAFVFQNTNLSTSYIQYMCGIDRPNNSGALAFGAYAFLAREWPLSKSVNPTLAMPAN
jgi:hypothetical protein